MATTRTMLDAEQAADAGKHPPAKTNIKASLDSAPAEGVAFEPEPEEIAELAYSYWLEREGNGEGSADEDWLRAEAELRRR